MTTENAREMRVVDLGDVRQVKVLICRGGFECLPTHSGRHTFSYPLTFSCSPPKHNILGCGWWNEVPDIVLPVAETVLSCVFDEASCPRLVNTGEGVQMNQKRSQKVFDDRWTEVKINVIFYVLLCCQRENVKGNIFKGTKISWLFKCF